MAQQGDFIGDYVGAKIAVGLALDSDPVAGDKLGTGFGEHVNGEIAVLYEEVHSLVVVIGDGSLEANWNLSLGFGVGERMNGAQRGQGRLGAVRRGPAHNPEGYNQSLHPVEVYQHSSISSAKVAVHITSVGGTELRG